MFLLINGIKNSRHSTTHQFALWLAAHGQLVMEGAYPVRHAWDAGRCHRYDAVRIWRQLDLFLKEHPGEPIDAVWHSHGNLIGACMLKLGLRLRNLFCVAPALDRDWFWPRYGFDRAWVIHNRRDKAIRWAPLLPLSTPDWGDMGRVGWHPPTPPGADWFPPVTNVENRDIAGPRNHSHYFTGPHLGRLGRFVLDSIGPAATDTE